MITKARNTLADLLWYLDRHVVCCRWHWLCVLPGMLWKHDLDRFE